MLWDNKKPPDYERLGTSVKPQKAGHLKGPPEAAIESALKSPPEIRPADRTHYHFLEFDLFAVAIQKHGIAADRDFPRSQMRRLVRDGRAANDVVVTIEIADRRGVVG